VSKALIVPAGRSTVDFRADKKRLQRLGAGLPVGVGGVAEQAADLADITGEDSDL
jgi:hypothetical protein